MERAPSETNRRECWLSITWEPFSNFRIVRPGGISPLARNFSFLRRGLGNLDLIGPTSRFPCFAFIPVRRQHV
jgi:hypothetical protein